MKWKPLEADGDRTDNVVCNVIAVRWRPVEADGGQVEAAQDMQITIVRTRMEASGDSKLYNTNIISGTAGGRKFQKRKHIEPIEMERLWFDVTHLFEELLLAFD